MERIAGAMELHPVTLRDISEVETWEREYNKQVASGIWLSCGVAGKFANIKLEDLDEVQRDLAGRFLAKIEKNKGAALWLCGKPGTGKSALAAAIAKKICDQGKRVMFLKSHMLTDSVQTKRKTLKEVENSIKGNALVVFEECGRYPLAQWESYYLFELVDFLYGENTNVILTTNQSKTEFGAFVGSACMDRFKGIAESYEFTGESYRGKENELYVR